MKDSQKRHIFAVARARNCARPVESALEGEEQLKEEEQETRAQRRLAQQQVSCAAREDAFVAARQNKQRHRRSAGRLRFQAFTDFFLSPEPWF